jgi:glutamate-1-semialdehyde aminotransferase
MNLQGPKTKSLFKKASDVIPYGVNSNFRYWGEDDRQHPGRSISVSG